MYNVRTMTEKIELDLDPVKCKECSNKTECFFGRFFSCLKEENCRLNHVENCNECPLQEGCVTNKFKIKTTLIIPAKQSKFFCEEK